MLRASEGLREGPSAGFWIWEGMLRLRRATRWRPAGAFGHCESAIEFGRAPPVSESRRSSSGVRRCRRSSRHGLVVVSISTDLALVSESQLPSLRVPGVESSGLFLIQAGDACRWDGRNEDESLVPWFVRSFTRGGPRVETRCLKILTTRGR